ncbi:hypothetical protein Glove_529g21 [Diversispora epigaea]|uniref:DNA-directed DNA polymerase n=1 Tax=Diversispora epigaea TaxID=1348612 RepID=A0A397GFA7_9GLOM|nr:hypothetical protein Glove_529g21 [Diversispora epigaea]
MSTQSKHDTPTVYTVPTYTEVSTVDSQNFQENIDHIPAEAEAPPSRPESPENSENFDPEIREEGNRGIYHREASTFSQSQVSESKEKSQVFYYNGEDYLPTRPSRNMMIAENNDYGSTYINNTPYYVLQLYGYLINGQKAVYTVPTYTEVSTVDSQNFQENIDHIPAEAEAPPSRPESPENSENFDPEIREEGNRGIYHREASTFSQSQVSESKEKSQVFYYNGEDYLPTRPSRNMMIAENNDYGSTLYGYLINGQKAVVTVSGIKVFFDIRIPDNKSIGIFETEIKNILVNGKNDEGETVDMAELQIEHIKAFPIRRYYVEKKPYLCIVITNIKQRKITLNIILEYNLKNEKKLETTSDDTTSIYYRKVAREYRIPLSGYRVPYSARSPLCEHAFYVSINDYRSVKDPSILYNSYPSQLITHDRTLVIACDIETHTTRGLEYVPVARYKEDNIFMICITVHWKDDPKPLKQICLVDVETVSDPNWITIICGNEKNLLKAFALLERATQHKILDWMVAKMSANPRKKATIDSILRWNYYGGLEDKEGKKIKNRKGIEIKIDSDKDFKSTFLKIPGCIPIDVVVCCKKLYPKSEKKSLNHFLKINGLDNKIDLPIKTMRRYYTQNSRSCQSLMVKNNIINDYRDVASIAYVSLFDSHYYAVGIKVRENKFPGAYVPPDKGLEDKYPVTGLDFASLYPSIIMNYNLSPEKITLLTEEVGALEKADEILHKIEFPFNGKTLYAWSIRHGNKDNKKRLYLLVLEELFNK